MIVRFLLVSLILVFAISTRSAASERVDVELVLAVDVSWSMDPDEQRLQRDGYVAAFRHGDVIQAIREGGWGSIAVTFVEWAGMGLWQVIVPWTRVHDEATANAFADRLSGEPIGRMTRTSISGAMALATRMFAESPFDGVRHVVDISGDGANNQGPFVTDARDRLVKTGIVINGLPIMIKKSNPSGFPQLQNLDVYYEDCVIGGTGSFIVTVREKTGFAAAIRRKLLLEIAEAPLPIIRAQAQTKVPRIDCKVGERLWREWWGTYGDDF